MSTCLIVLSALPSLTKRYWCLLHLGRNDSGNNKPKQQNLYHNHLQPLHEWSFCVSTELHLMLRPLAEFPHLLTQQQP